MHEQNHPFCLFPHVDQRLPAPLHRRLHAPALGALLIGGLLPASAQAAPQYAQFDPAQVVELSGPSSGGPIVADLNGGGQPDILLTHQDGRTQAAVYFGEGERRFEDENTFGVGWSGGYLRVADFNEDGDPDIAVGVMGYRTSLYTYESPCGSHLNAVNELPVLLGDGEGGFNVETPCLVMEVNYGYFDTYVSGMAVADFNEDGHQDIIVSRTGNYGAKYIAKFFGNGDGTFSEAVKVEFPRPKIRGSADFNNDGHVDLLINTSYGNYTYYGDGQGGFAGGTLIRPDIVGDPAGQGPYGLLQYSANWAMGDVNADGYVDLVNHNYDSITILLGQNTGVFTFSQTVEVGRPQDPKVADVNADGHADLVVATQYGDSALVFYGDSSGQFTTEPQLIPLEGGREPVALAAADLDSNTTVDLFVVNRNAGDQATATVLYQIEDNGGTQPPPPDPAPDPAPTAPEVELQSSIETLGNGFIVVAGTTVWYTQDTVIKFEDGTGGAFAVGQSVELKGLDNGDGTITAQKMNVGG